MFDIQSDRSADAVPDLCLQKDALSPSCFPDTLLGAGKLVPELVPDSAGLGGIKG
jgi:hypothetical protein